MDKDLLVLVCKTAGHFKLRPLLDNLERQRSNLNDRTVLDQHATE